MSTYPAMQIRILDLAMQAYLQRHPFADGPDREMNAAARKAIVAGLFERPPAPPYTPILLAAAETQLPSKDEDALDRLFTQLHIGVDRQNIYRNDMAWEANLVPRTAKNVLVIGCGDGVEVLFLRAILPEARITAIDYGNSLLPGLQDAVGLRFIEGDMNMHLRSLVREYDLVFSNHTMEHLYTPDEMLAVLASLLLPGGHLVSILPMVGKEGVPFLEKIHAAIESKQSHPMDMVFLDAGHPWKTNPGDLKHTLERAWFADVTLYQRQDHLSRPLRLSPEKFRRKRQWHVLCNRLLFAPLRTLLKSVFRSSVPEKLPKLFNAVERRSFCGANKIMNFYAEEALVIGQLPA